MITLSVLAIVVLWIFSGIVAGRMVLVDFEEKFGEGVTETSLIATIMPLGPLGIVVAGLAGSGLVRQLRVALGLESATVQNNHVFYIDKPRSAFQTRLSRGIKGLPDYDRSTIAQANAYPIIREHTLLERQARKEQFS